MKRLVILILLMGALIIPLTAYAQPQTAPSVVATGSDNVPKPMAYVAFKGSDGQVQKQIFELDQDNVVTVNQNGRLSFSAVGGISISMVKITDVNKVTYGVPVQDNSVVMSVPRGVYSLNAISGPYAYTGIVVVTGPQSQAAGQSQGQGGGQDNDPEIITIIDRVIIDTITFIDIWIITLFQPIPLIPVGVPADLALNGIGEACYGNVVDLTDTLNCPNVPNDLSVFDPALRDVGELTDEDTKDTENDDNVDNDATTQQDSPIDDIPMSNACQQGCINLVEPSGHDNPPHTGDNTASSHQSGDENNNDNEGDEGGSNEGGEGDNEESGSSEEED